MKVKTQQEIKQIFKECLELGIQKNQDYSGFIDNIGLTGLEGISVRMLDKAARIYTLTHRSKRFVKNEKLEDTFKDIINYASYGICLLRKKWKI